MNDFKVCLAFSNAQVASSLNLAASCTRLSTSCWKLSENIGTKIFFIPGDSIYLTTEPDAFVFNCALPYFPEMKAYIKPVCSVVLIRHTLLA